MRDRWLNTLILCSCVSLSALGCGSTPDGATNSPGDGGPTDAATEDRLDVFSWWIAPGEAEALQALINTYKGAYPSARVSTLTEVMPGAVRGILDANIRNAPWDVFQQGAANYPGFLEQHPGSLVQLDEIYNEPSLKAAIIPRLLDALMIDGHPYGALTGVHRNNSFIFNKQILDAQRLAPPTTIAEFLDVCAKLKAAGITPVAATFQQWALIITLDDILSGTLGAAAFQSLVLSTTPTTDPAVRAGVTSAVDTFAKMLTDYVDPASKEPAYGWSQAAESLHDGKAAMFFMGDWAKGYLTSLGWTPGVDFGVSGPPGAFDLFWYGDDSFAIPVSAMHQKNARNFLSVVTSKAAQVAFNKQKGSTPIRSDVRDQLDEPGKTSLDNMLNAKVLARSVPANMARTAALTQFLIDGEKAPLIEAYLTANR
jgi:glucose/mannose transport system substrate-binding protein